MDIIQLMEKGLIDPETEAHYAFLCSMKYTTGIHCHDFFELFLITGGSVIHVVNGSHQPLGTGSLVFIRPEDVHYYEKDGDNDCQLINLAFPKRAVEALFIYLGVGFFPERLLSPTSPPSVLLSEAEREIARKRLELLFTIRRSDKHEIKTALRALLVEFLTRYFSMDTLQKVTALPEWLESLTYEMTKKENFAPGLPVMQRLSGKTPEHLCRVFMKYINKTPSEYINEIRLNYAANLLTHTDEAIITIAMDSGFDNLSHFYHLFKKRFGMSPAQFRKINQKVVVPIRSEE